MLDVDLLFLVTGPSRREPVEVAAVHPALNLLLVVVLGVLRLVAKEKPIPALGFVVNTLFHERTEGRNARSGSDHDDVHVSVVGEHEALGWGHEDVDWRSAGVDLVGHVQGAEATALAAVVFEADDAHGQFDQTRVGVGGRGDAVEAGLDLARERQELLRGIF